MQRPSTTSLYGSRVLLIDDDEDTRDLGAMGLAKHGYQTQTCSSVEEALELLERSNGELGAVVTDLQLGSRSGLEVCEWVTQNRPDTPVILVTGHGSLDAAIGAIRVGVWDFINKPIDLSRLAHSLERALSHSRLKQEVTRLRESVARPAVAAPIVGESRAIRAVLDLVERLHESDVSVLITGESGTGKELVARALHNTSNHAEGPFVAVNCAAMPAALLESELFGHKRGAFTDAREDREGLFVRASGGTIFLDEIGEMPMEMQAKLLRTLQDSRVRPVGSDDEVAFEARVLSATNRDLEDAVEQGTFREDLYYRLNVVHVPVPPLRARDNDVLLLAQHFIEAVVARTGKQVVGLSSQAAQKLIDYHWPGNVRELQNCIERAVALTRFEELTVDDLPPKIRRYQATRLVLDADDVEQMLTLEAVERRYIARVLEATGGNKTHAARVLGLDRRTLYRKLDRLEIGDKD
ncbi:MAG: sigma-54-dependent Fis family transcriptional regulator [Myxococcales bacterium]|nr:sigma-54-dependent Fis family transcriptional regulator [Myxococcales bacterium]